MAKKKPRSVLGLVGAAVSDVVDAASVAAKDRADTGAREVISHLPSLASMAKPQIRSLSVFMLNSPHDDSRQLRSRRKRRNVFIVNLTKPTLRKHKAKRFLAWRKKNLK